eukprot:jgi/Ulvmu1/10710/UM067_0036.1
MCQHIRAVLSSHLQTHTMGRNSHYAVLGLLVLSVCPCSLQSAYALESREASGRRLQQSAGVRVADFTSIFTHPFNDIDMVVGESSLGATINLTATTDDSSPPGTYLLAPSQVQQLDEAVLGQLRTIPPSEATPTPLIPHPGVTIRGNSYTAGPGSERTLPTVFAPFHAGTVFRLADNPTPQGTTLHFANMTLLMPNVTFAGVFDSGFLDFFDIGDTAIICFTNSILVLESCAGFAESTYHMWCCTTHECNDFFTQQKLATLGHHDGSMQNLEYIQCYAYAVDWAALSNGNHPAIADGSAAPAAAHSTLAAAILSLVATAAMLAAW